MKDYRINFRVKNNRMLSKIEQSEYKTIFALCKRLGVPSLEFYNLVNMKISPLRRNGDWKKSVLDMCDVLNCSPEDLFSKEQMVNTIQTNNFTLTASLQELGKLSERSLSTRQEFKVLDKNTKDVLLKVLEDNLTARQRDIIIRSFGLFGHEKQTLEEIGKFHNLGRERVRQLVNKSLGKLGKLKNSEDLKAMRSLLSEHNDAHQGRLY